MKIRKRERLEVIECLLVNAVDPISLNKLLGVCKLNYLQYLRYERVLLRHGLLEMTDHPRSKSWRIARTTYKGLLFVKKLREFNSILNEFMSGFSEDPARARARARTQEGELLVAHLRTNPVKKLMKGFRK